MRIGQRFSMDKSHISGTATFRRLAVGDGPSGEFIIDWPFDREETRSGPLVLEDTEVVGTVRIGSPSIVGGLAIRNLAIIGHLSCEAADLPSNFSVSGLKIKPGMANQAVRREEAVRYKRELFVLRKALQRAGDIDGYVEMLRTSRSIETRLGQTTLAGRAAWFLHELASNSGGSWAWPVIWSAACAVLFTSVYAYGFLVSVGQVDWRSVTLLTVLNTFVPFVFTQAHPSSQLPFVVLLAALVHSILSVGLLTTLILAIRTRQFPED
jgi:hypothetical protein